MLDFQGWVYFAEGLVEERGEGELGELFPSFRGEMTRDWMLPANTVPVADISLHSSLNSLLTLSMNLSSE